MKYLISRGDYERVTAGMNPGERAQIDALFERYPEVDDDGREVLKRVDQDRVAARFAQLLAVEPPRLRFEPGRRRRARLIEFEDGGDPPETNLVWFAPKGNGKTSGAARLPEPWRELGPGVWVAPVDTPPPDAPQSAEDFWA